MFAGFILVAIRLNTGIFLFVFILLPINQLGDLWIGDTLFFPALTIHKALPNYTEDKLRISLDNRYQAVGDPIAAHMLEPHWPSQLSWDEVYADWENDDLKYYWQQLDNPVVPFDASFHEKGFAEAIELARAGDQHAIYSMKRIVKDNQGLPFKAKAQSVLAEL